jgi:hypothetical protein
VTTGFPCEEEALAPIRRCDAHNPHFDVLEADVFQRLHYPLYRIPIVLHEGTAADGAADSRPQRVERAESQRRQRNTIIARHWNLKTNRGARFQRSMRLAQVRNDSRILRQMLEHERTYHR